MNHPSALHNGALLLLRLVLGGSMIAGHGWRKLKQVIGGGEIQFGDPLGLSPEISLYLAVFAEVFCALLVVIGLFTRLAAIPLIIMMSVVIFFVQLGKPFSYVELPLIILTGFIVIAVFGAGRYSIDHFRKNRY